MNAQLIKNRIHSIIRKLIRFNNSVEIGYLWINIFLVWYISIVMIGVALTYFLGYMYFTMKLTFDVSTITSLMNALEISCGVFLIYYLLYAIMLVEETLSFPKTED